MTRLSISATGVRVQPTRKKPPFGIPDFTASGGDIFYLRAPDEWLAATALKALQGVTPLSSGSVRLAAPPESLELHACDERELAWVHRNFFRSFSTSAHAIPSMTCAGYLEDRVTWKHSLGDTPLDFLSRCGCAQWEQRPFGSLSAQQRRILGALSIMYIPAPVTFIYAPGFEGLKIAPAQVLEALLQAGSTVVISGDGDDHFYTSSADEHRTIDLEMNQ